MPFTPDHLVIVAPGQQVAVDESGDPRGYPVFFFHGWPASRLQGSGFTHEARELGLRILAPDRPGVGLSTAQPGRSLLDWPPVVRALARHFGAERFSVLAVSGGGPYALATGFALADCVDVVSVVSGAPPLGPETDRRALLPVYRVLLGAYQRWPRTLGHLFHLARPLAHRRLPKWSHPLLLRLAPKCDRPTLREKDVIGSSVDVYHEAWRSSGRGVFSDAEVYAQDWGFRPEEICVPVRLWHGKGDSSFSWKLAEALAARIPECEARFMEGEGHYSLPIKLRREILVDLVAARDARAARV